MPYWVCLAHSPLASSIHSLKKINILPLYHNHAVSLDSSFFFTQMKMIITKLTHKFIYINVDS